MFESSFSLTKKKDYIGHKRGQMHGCACLPILLTLTPKFMIITLLFTKSKIVLYFSKPTSMILLQS